MNKPTSNTAQTITLISVLIILLAFGLSYLFFIPQLVKAKTALVTAQAQSAGLDQDQQTLQQAQQNLTTAEQQLTSEGVNFNSLSSIYPATEDIPDLYLQMESQMAHAASIGQGVSATYTLSDPVSEADKTAQIPLSFTATGQFADLETFMSQLEDNIRPVIITSLSFGPASASTETGASTPVGALTLTMTGYTVAAGISSAYASLTPTP